MCSICLKEISTLGMFFLVFKARLSLQVHNNRHLCCHGISGGNQTLLGICWKSSGKGILTSIDFLNVADVEVFFLRYNQKLSIEVART